MNVTIKRPVVSSESYFILNYNKPDTLPTICLQLHGMIFSVVLRKAILYSAKLYANHLESLYFTQKEIKAHFLLQFT